MSERPRLVLLHGWGSTSRVWDSIMPGLKASYRCQAFDLPGHGDSSLNETRLEPLAEQLLEQVREPAIWLGWSLGALIAMQAALLMPQLVDRLLLVAATPAFVQQDGWSNAMPMSDFDRFQFDFANQPARTMKRFIALQSMGDQQSKHVARQLSKAACEPLADIGWGLVELGQTDLRLALTGLNCETHGLYGDHDALVPAAVANVLQQSAGVGCTTWKGVGHAPFLSRPQEFVQWIDGVGHA